MGLNISAMEYIQQIGSKLFPEDLRAPTVCLLGNLYLARGTEELQRQYGTRIAHDFFKHLGAKVISIDINGKDGALALDLSKTLPNNMGQFDLVINGGTSEHVSNQYMCFNNIHNLCTVGGLMFHMVPYIGHWDDHGLYAYETLFFADLARVSNYDTIDIHIDDYVSKRTKGRNDLVFACLRKKLYSKEINAVEFMKVAHIIKRKG